jgi:spermidine synthase
MVVYAATIFLSAFLLFQVQPMIAKFILPWFGGSAAVWSAALLFFQLVLLAGYAYSHFLIRHVSPRRQMIVHGGLLLVALATLPIIPAAHWKPMGGDDPTLRILLLLGATIGLPYMLLSSTSPLLQAWYVRTHKGVIPYRLFALSNFGSMLALLSYPTLVEPRLALTSQARIWSIGFGVFAVACILAAWKSREGFDPVHEKSAESDAPKPSLSTILLWISLSACASALLLATTSHLTQNVAPIPLLWVAPLSLYLLSFILCFESDKIYQRWLFLPFGGASLALYSYGMRQFEDNGDVIKTLIPALCGALFICCMVCHGELAKRKPHPRYLTQYFLMISVGGAIGGLFVAFVAPRVFSSYLEMPISVAACGVLMAIVLWNDEEGKPRPLWIRIPLALAAIVVAFYLGRLERQENADYYLTARNFYGVLRVRDEAPDGATPGQRVLIHGTINHGTEIKVPNSGRVPTSYFGRTSGISRAIRMKQEKGPIHIGILGLGAGVTATLANQGDTLHYYEINPLVFQIAQSEFNFWKACPADKKLFLGDGRLVLESLPDENLDFLAMDAFTSDAVPMHLLTVEAYKTYARHLKQDGYLAVNISNRYLDLEPVVAEAAKVYGFSGIVVSDETYEEPYYTGNTWVIMTRAPEQFSHPNFQETYIQPFRNTSGFKPWTDDYSNIIQILR